MWRSIMLFGILIAAPAAGFCDTVQFTVNPGNTGIVYKLIDVDLFSPDLNGTVLAGQSLSLDLVLSNDVLARLTLLDPQVFGIELIVSTGAGTSPGFAGPSTGFLLDPHDNKFGDAQIAGTASGSDGTFVVGLVSFNSSKLAGASVIDINGVHFDTMFPSTGFAVTNAQLRFSLNSQENAIEFGTANQLPEPTTLILLLLSGLLVVVVRLKSLSVL